MASDAELADAIRAAVNALRMAVIEARNGGLTVSVPIMLSHWVDAGTAPGEPAMWVINRKSL